MKRRNSQRRTLTTTRGRSSARPFANCCKTPGRATGPANSASHRSFITINKGGEVMQSKQFRRRRALIQAGGTLAGAALLGLPMHAFAQARGIKIGFVSPQTGPLAPFGEADNFVIGQMNKLFAGGIAIGGKKVPVTIIQKDSQSNPNRAGEVANDLILKEKVDIMLVSGTPETANPVSDACELNEMPCVSTVVPWQPWFFGRKGDPKKGFRFTYHFFWGLEDVIAVYTGMWQSVQTNHSVGGLFPNDGDGNAWGDAKLGFPPVLAQKGFALKDPGRFQSMTQDFSAQISSFN